MSAPLVALTAIALVLVVLDIVRGLAHRRNRHQRLYHCLDHGGWWYVLDLMRCTGLSPAFIVVELAKLERNGAVAVRWGPDNGVAPRRVQYATLTTAALTEVLLS